MSRGPRNPHRSADDPLQVRDVLEHLPKPVQDRLRESRASTASSLAVMARTSMRERRSSRQACVTHGGAGMVEQGEQVFSLRPEMVSNSSRFRFVVGPSIMKRPGLYNVREVCGAAPPCCGVSRTPAPCPRPQGVLAVFEPKPSMVTVPKWALRSC